MSAVYEMPSYNNKLMKSYNTKTVVESLTRSIQSNVLLTVIECHSPDDYYSSFHIFEDWRTQIGINILATFITR